MDRLFVFCRKLALIAFLIQESDEEQSIMHFSLECTILFVDH